VGRCWARPGAGRPKETVMTGASLLEVALKRDRYLVIAGIAIVIAFSRT